MNIGIVTTWFERGAAYVSKQYEQSLDSKNSVFIYARGGEHYEKKDKNWVKENVYWSKRYNNNVNTFMGKKEFFSWIKNNKIEVVLFNEQHFWLPVLWCKKAGIKCGIYVDYYTEETIPFFTAFDFILCNTKRHFSVFKDLKQSCYIPWGTDIELFRPEEKRKEDKNKTVFFTSCGYNPRRKGVHALLQAFSEIDTDNYKLVIHTQVDLEKFFPEYINEIKRLKRMGCLEVIQKTITAPGLYHYGDVYCYLSILDGIGLTLPEALSCGLAAIIPDNGPMNEFVIDERVGKKIIISKYYSRKDGYYWPQCEVEIESLKEALYSYILNKDQIDKKFIRDYAVANFNWKDREQQILEIFDKIEKQELNEKIKKRIMYFEAKKAVRSLRTFLNTPLYYLMSATRLIRLRNI